MADEFRVHVGRQLEEEVNQSLRRPRYIPQERSPTPDEQARADLLGFMAPQVRAEYDKADADHRKVIWEANKRAFEAAKKRKEEKLRHEQELMAKVYDMLQRIKEDPSKHDLLPPDDASTSDLQKWYEEMQKPVRKIPFPGEGGYPQDGLPCPQRRWKRQQIPNPTLQRMKRRGLLGLGQKNITGDSLPIRARRTIYMIGALWYEGKIGVRGKIQGRQSPMLRFLPKRRYWKSFGSSRKATFWGGGVGMALVALGFRWGNAPPWFTVTLLVLAWLIFSISVYKHKFFERWSPFRQLLGNAGVSVVIALILSAAWVGLRPSIQRQAVTQSATPSPTVATVVASPRRSRHLRRYTIILPKGITLPSKQCRSNCVSRMKV